MAVLKRKSLQSSFWICIVTLFFTINVGSVQSDPRIEFAQQITNGINTLVIDTESLGLSLWKEKQLTRRLKLSDLFLDQGIKKLQAGREDKAINRFKLSRFFINTYLKALSYKVKEGSIDPADAIPLQEKARQNRNKLTQLINGELGNTPPVANAGMDQSVETREIVTLDGSGSNDPEGSTLFYQWMIINQPEGSISILDDNQSITPTFIPDLVGTYEIELVVDDGQLSSLADSVVVNVSASNTRPVADAGPDQNGFTDETITLDGSGSNDVDGDSLSYNWVLNSFPSGSSAELNDNSAVKPFFIADQVGRYEAELTVNDGQADSAPDAVTINIEILNTKPVANAGLDQSVLTNQQVQLDGSSSNDIDGDTLTWQWALISKPAGSIASLDDEDIVDPSFVSDVAGQYVVQLIVNDGQDDSDPDTVLINAETPNTRPIADAGPDQSDLVGNLITLDGSASSDADNDPLTFDWSLISLPIGSQASLDNQEIVNPSFILDVPGDYIAQLIVNDGMASSTPDETVISTISSRPVADAGPDQTIFYGQFIELDGGGSYDASDDALTYEWSVLSFPPSGWVSFPDETSVTQQIPPDLPGTYVFQLIVNDGVMDSLPDTVKVDVLTQGELTIDLIDPESTYTAVRSRYPYIYGTLSHYANMWINGEEVDDVQEPSFEEPNEPVEFYHEQFWLQEGANNFTLYAEDAAGNTASLDFTFVYDITPPPAPDLNLITISEPDENQKVLITGSEGSVEALSVLTITNALTLDQYTVEVDEFGAFSVEIDGVQGDVFTLKATDAARWESPEVETSIAFDTSIPPDPSLIATPLSKTEVTSFLDATSFLYSGISPIQRGVRLGTINPLQAAVIRGRVLDDLGDPLPGVIISVKDNPQYGITVSRADGVFDLVVNGGGQVTLDFTSDNKLPLQRTINTYWRDYSWVDEVVMIGLDDQVTTIDLTSASPMQIAKGSVVTDSRGTRQTAVMFPEATTATVTLPDGTTQALNTLSVRATEYTIGGFGPNRMPGELPVSSGYTFAVELSVDEAIALGVDDIQFGQPLSLYVDNFLEFPVGAVVPVGYYDREQAGWVPSSNGKVIKIVGVSNGIADISVHEGGVTLATTTELNALGITNEERAQLALSYSVGDQLMRAQIDHMTPWDFNFPYGLQQGAISPVELDNTENAEIGILDARLPSKSSLECGSIIDVEARDLGERIDIAGTDYSLNYRSSRTLGNQTDNTMEIKLIGSTVPDTLEGIELHIGIAGNLYSQTYPAEPDQTVTWTWDGLDAYGRDAGTRQATIRIDYLYTPVYFEASDDFEASFAQPGLFENGEPSIISGRNESQIRVSDIWRGEPLTVGNIDSDGLGGWMLSSHHFYHPVKRTLYMGDGRKRDIDNAGNIIKTVGGNGSSTYYSNTGVALEVGMTPKAITVDADGSILIVDNNFPQTGTQVNKIRKITTDGMLETLAGSGSYYFEGGNALSAPLNRPNDVAIGPDGSIYIANTNASVIRKIDLKGKIRTFAGTGGVGYAGDGGPATNAQLRYPLGVSVDRDGTVYIADTGNDRIRKVTPDGVIETIAGNGIDGFSGDFGSALDARLDGPRGVYIHDDGTLYFADEYNDRIRAISPQGIITTVAGGGDGLALFLGDGGKATDAELNFPEDVHVGPDGVMYIADTSNHRIRAVNKEGIINTIAGVQKRGFNGDGEFAVNTRLFYPNSIDMDGEGNLYIADTNNSRVRKISSMYGRSLVDIFIPSEDGYEVYQFSSSGRHAQTINALTQSNVYGFQYDDNGLLESVTDAHGNITSITRDANQQATTIVSADGQVTLLGHDSNGYLQSVTNPLNEVHSMGYDTNGLLKSFTNPRNKTSLFQYDNVGRLFTDVNAEGGGWTLSESYSSATEFHRVELESAMNRLTRSITDYEDNGDEKRIYFNPDNSGYTSVTNVLGVTNTETTDGVKTETAIAKDPLFGMQSPYVSMSKVTLPSGLVSLTETEETAEFAEAGNVFSLTTLTETISTNGRDSTRIYDAQNQIWIETSPEGRTNTVQVNAKEQPVVTQVSGFEPMSYDYDARGRLYLITEGSGAESRSTMMTFYSSGPMAGYLETITNAENQVIRFEYDAVGRVEKRILPDLREITYTYDANGNLSSLTPPGRPAHLYQYDDVNQATEYIPPSVAGIIVPETIYNFNLDKQLISITRPDQQKVIFNYGATTGKLDSMVIPTGTYTYSYDATSGQLDSITAPNNGTISYDYDGFLTTNTTWTGEVSGSVDRFYDNDFRISSRSINGGNAISFGYDDDSLLSSAGAMSISREVQKAGLINGTTLGSMNTSRTYNGFAELDTFDASYNATSLFSTGYERDKLGRITQKTETIQGVTSVTDYDYDLSGRLESETTGSTTTSYTYDSNGNRTHINGSLVGAYDDQDRMTSYSDATYKYTDNGELLSKNESGQITQYEYDVLGNLRQVTLPDGNFIKYLIDGQNRRVGKKLNGVMLKGFLYKDQLNPIAELDGDNNIVSRFIYGTKVNVPDYMVRDDRTYRIITDHLGSPRLVVNIADGSVAQRIDYDTWGNVINDTSPGFQPFGFAGGLYDKDTHLTRFGVRDYDPWIGRWTSQDPIRFDSGDTNLYGYVISDPVNFVDLNGMEKNWSEKLKVKIGKWFKSLGDVISAREKSKESIKKRNDLIGDLLAQDAAGGGPTLEFDEHEIQKQMIEDLLDVTKEGAELVKDTRKFCPTK